MTNSPLTPDALAQRWDISEHTLSKWRWSGRGPLFLKIGGKILYNPEDIEAFEKQSRRKNTSQSFA